MCNGEEREEMGGEERELERWRDGKGSSVCPGESGLNPARPPYPAFNQRLRRGVVMLQNKPVEGFVSYSIINASGIDSDAPSRLSVLCPLLRGGSSSEER